MSENPYEAPLSTSIRVRRRLTPGRVFSRVAFGFVSLNAVIIFLHLLFPKSEFMQLLPLPNTPGVPLFFLLWQQDPPMHYFAVTLAAMIATSTVVWAGIAALIAAYFMKPSES